MSSPSVSGDKYSDDPLLANARKLLADADAELVQQARDRPKMPDRPFVTGIVSFLSDPAAALNLLVFSLWINISLNLASIIVVLSNDVGLSQILAVFLIVLLAVVMLPFVLWFSAACLAVARDSASGLAKIESWPGLDPTECISMLPYTLLSFCLAAIPAYLLGQVLVLSNAPVWAAVATGLATMTLLYPIALASTIESGSPIGILSPAIINSLNVSLVTWCRFYLLSAGLVLIGVLAVWLIWVTWFLLGFLWSIPLIAATMVYHRLLGRLAWVLTTRGEPQNKTAK